MKIIVYETYILLVKTCDNHILFMIIFYYCNIFDVRIFHSHRETFVIICNVFSQFREPREERKGLQRDSRSSDPRERWIRSRSFRREMPLFPGRESHRDARYVRRLFLYGRAHRRDFADNARFRCHTRIWISQVDKCARVYD